MNKNSLYTQVFKSELQTLLASSDTKDAPALAAFSKAIQPYLDDPAKLRTFLSKILQVGDISADTHKTIESGTFGSIEDVRALLPTHVTARLSNEVTA